MIINSDSVKYTRDGKKFFKFPKKERISKNEYIEGIENINSVLKIEKEMLERKIDDMNKINENKRRLLKAITEIMNAPVFIDCNLTTEAEFLDITQRGDVCKNYKHVADTYNIVVKIPVNDDNNN